MMEDMGMEIEGKVPIYTDASAALGMVQRKGARKVRHVDTRLLWIQQDAVKRLLDYWKTAGKDNPADIFTKPVKEELFCQLRHMFMHNCHPNTIDAIALPVQD